MRVRWLVPLCALLCASAPGAARAEFVDGLYTANLPAADRSPATLGAARRDGLAQVLVKVTGAAPRPDNAAVRAALDKAERYLSSYSYEASAPGELRLRLVYDASAVRALLREAGLPLWTAHRPRVLVWWVTHVDGRRRFVSAQEQAPAHQALRDSFARRGVPLQLPLFDLEDIAKLSPGQAWRQSSAALLDASQRYRGAQLLTARAARLSDGNWSGDWRMLHEGRWLSRSARGLTLEQFTALGAALAAEALASRYAVTLHDALDQRHRVTLRGIRDYRDYQSAQATLAALEAVRRVVPEYLLGDQVSLRIEADTDLAQLARIIELDARFVPTPAGSGSGLAYEWMQ